MNPKIFMSSIALSALLFASCKKELEPQENTPTSELIKLGLVQDTAKVKSIIETQGQAQVANTNTVMSTASGMNPAHGQPGHRCDIAVGAPLNSAPGQAQTQTATTQTAQAVPVSQNNITTTTTVATPAKVGKGMNPAHGQPGHRCDIPVGAPLNSPTAAKQTATSTTTTSTSQGGTATQNFTVSPPANNVPALLSTDANATKAVAEGMNPAHGQPGHRCDIAVGSPLPKS